MACIDVVARLRLAVCVSMGSTTVGIGAISPNRRGQGALWQLTQPSEESADLADSESGEDSGG